MLENFEVNANNGASLKTQAVVSDKNRTINESKEQPFHSYRRFNYSDCDKVW